MTSAWRWNTCFLINIFWNYCGNLNIFHRHIKQNVTGCFFLNTVYTGSWCFLLGSLRVGSVKRDFCLSLSPSASLSFSLFICLSLCFCLSVCVSVLNRIVMLCTVFCRSWIYRTWNQLTTCKRCRICGWVVGWQTLTTWCNSISWPVDLSMISCNIPFFRLFFLSMLRTHWTCQPALAIGLMITAVVMRFAAECMMYVC